MNSGDLHDFRINEDVISLFVIYVFIMWIHYVEMFFNDKDRTYGMKPEEGVVR